MTSTVPRPVSAELPPGPEPDGPSRLRGGLLTAGAAVLLFAALVLPREVGQLGPAAFLRLPVEALAGAVVVLLLPPRAGRRVAAACGVLLAVLTVVKAIDMGFLEALGRPFDPVADWSQLGSGVGFVADAAGDTAAVVAVVVAVLLVIALAVLMALSARRLARVLQAHRRRGARTVAVLGAVWVVLAALGAQLVAPLPLASRSAASLAFQKAEQIPTSIADQRAFAARFAGDPFRGVPPGQLLGGLRGKDLLLTFVESYGRSALEDPQIAPMVTPTLDEGTRRLAASGWSARSGWLTSPISGGGSWMAHATFQSGLRVSNQKQFDLLAGSDRLTLSARSSAPGGRRPRSCRARRCPGRRAGCTTSTASTTPPRSATAGTRSPGSTPRTSTRCPPTTASSTTGPAAVR